jgi:hypothetical protein
MYSTCERTGNGVFLLLYQLYRAFQEPQLADYMRKGHAVFVFILKEFNGH